MQADVAVVVVAYNSAGVIADLLDSVPAGLGGLTADVVVVDNGSTDGTAGLLADRTDCRVVRSSNRGYAAGINLGVAQAVDAPAILVLNPDVRLLPGCVPPLVEALATPGVGIAVPQIRTPAGDLDFTLRNEPSLPRALGLNRTRLDVFSEHVSRPEVYERPHAVDWATGAAMLVSRACHEALGGWDESFFLYSEETDFCLRARDAGLLTWYEPRSVVVHLAGASGRNDRTHAMQILNRVRLYHRRHGPAASWAYLWANVASEATWVLRGHEVSRASIAALLRPDRRPPELGCSDRIMPS